MRFYGAPAIRKHWRFILYLAGGWFLVGTGVIQQHLRDFGYTDFVYYRWLFGLNPAIHVSMETIIAALTRPTALLTVAVLIAGMFALPVLGWRWLLLVIPPYLANVLSEHDPQNLLRDHYALLLLFPLLVAGGVGARKLLAMRSVRPAAMLLVAVPALLLGWGTGRLPPALESNNYLFSRPNAVAELQNATSMVPANAPVNADDALAVWLANRHTINDFPDRLDATCYVVIDRQAYIDGPTQPDLRNAAIAALPGGGRSLLYDDGRFEVWSPVGD